MIAIIVKIRGKDGEGGGGMAGRYGLMVVLLIDRSQTCRWHVQLLLSWKNLPDWLLTADKGFSFGTC
jgi:hypothetical protein